MCRSEPGPMPKRKISPRYIADHIRRVLKDGGSAPHAEDVQWFFKEEIQSRGWYTAELRKVAVRFRRTIKSERGTEFLIKVANDLFRGKVLEEKVFAVLMLETLTDEFGDPEFQLFESWLDRISSWADHDALVHYLIAPMIAAKPSRKETGPRIVHGTPSSRSRSSTSCLLSKCGTPVARSALPTEE